MKNLLAVVAMALLSLGGLDAAYAEDYGKQKVAYHINVDDPKVLKVAMINIQNHIDAVGEENLDLRVVMHGPGLTLLRLANEDMNIQDKVSDLKRQGIHFIVCANTLNQRKIDYKNDLYDVSKQDIVPSGVAEIAYLQSRGYSYVKP